MDKEDIKIKYIIGSFRDELEYPTTEDFLYLINHWYYHEGGKSFIHDYRAIDDVGSVVFPDNILKEKLSIKKDNFNQFLNLLIKSSKIEVVKQTKFTTYYKIK